jgi:hypothetical protein
VKARRYGSFGWVVAIGLLPLMLLGLYVLAMQVYSRLRYTWAYFTPEYTAKYDTPGSVAKALETALQTGDRAMMAELKGRRSSPFEAMPNMVFVMLQERTDRYSTYLYLDRETYDRYTFYMEKVRGRYVVTPPNAYYYLHSGKWIGVFVPISIAWWVVELLVVLALSLYRLSTRVREQMYGG